MIELTRITQNDMAGHKVEELADTPDISTTALKKKFDELSTEVIAPKFNELAEQIEGLDIDKRVKSETITDMKLDEDNGIQVSTDGGNTYKATSSSGHIIVDGSDFEYPQERRLKFSDNVSVEDRPEDKTTFISIPPGEKGAKGDAAKIKVGDVRSGDEADVENVGSETDAIFDFVLPRGEKGDAATIQIGRVDTGEPGTPASVINSGDSKRAKFNFVIPQGEKGDPGTGLTLKDTYPNYEALKQAHPTGVSGDAYIVGTPDNNTVYLWSRDNGDWTDVGQLKGEKGDKGNAGTIQFGEVEAVPIGSQYVNNVGTLTEAILNIGLPQGERGERGQAASISVGEVISGDYPSVVNVGTSTRAVFDFIIPRGERGPQGNPTTVNGKSGVSIQLYGSDIKVLEDSDETIADKFASLKTGGSIFKLKFSEEYGNKFGTLTTSGNVYEFDTDALGEATIEGILEVGEMTILCSDIEYTFSIECYSMYVITPSSFGYTGWLKSAEISDTFGSLEELLKDEKAIRTLMTKHASVDYLTEWGTKKIDDVKVILENDLCAKWINLRDYALDTLYSSEVVKIAMDEIDKYGYGEWALIDDEWQPKGNVPVMTSNTAPYGTALSSNERTGYSSYLAFDGDVGTYTQQANTITSGAWNGYKFVNPVNVKRIRVIRYGVIAYDTIVKVQYSDDGNNWNDASAEITITGTAFTYANTEESGYHLYWRIYLVKISTGSTTAFGISEIQFYGRELKASVPRMTSNTSPWGEVTYSSELGTSNSYAYKAFDGNKATSDYWIPKTGSTSHWLAYKFPKKVNIKQIEIYLEKTTADPPAYLNSIVAWNDGESEQTIFDTQTQLTSKTDNKYTFVNIEDLAEYQNVKFNVSRASGLPFINMIQIYGLDYSEHDEREYIYDHGLEIMPLDLKTVVTGSSTAVNSGSSIMAERKAGSDICVPITNDAVDLTNYKLVRVCIGGFLNTANVSTHATKVNTQSAYKTIEAALSPNNNYLDVSSANSSFYLGFYLGSASSNNKVEVTEWWLE